MTTRQRLDAGMTLVELVVTMAVLATLGAVGYSAYDGVRQSSRDHAAIALADQLAGNYQHYAALNGGAFPQSLQAASWTASVSALGSLTEFGPALPQIFADGTGDTAGALFHTWTDATGDQFQMTFKAAKGTGQVYCRDLIGIGTLGSAAISTNSQANAGCP